MEGISLDCTSSAVQLFAEVQQFSKNKVSGVEYVGG